ncbi:pseudouridine synthase [Candidatus Woesearchaeota archaeon CG11_big_fil_rev_8_21_14_0_20_43_8]|nr:MAG: pseudouridine synthase [Candidatus Woesearchaeota archaeon CG11_big_fil_rev_8_21_14_0_20_43_8]PIO04998.1 MAG: pseudouridine synthase [Candidatus Woesearchaeota archaeon CG08_land_8_20_14_0_20_43_7]
MERVQKIISNAGYCSRRKAEDLIEEGKVKVNGKKIILGDKADPEIDKITVEGKKIIHARKLYVMMYKPKNYETTLADGTEKKTIKNLLKFKERIYPIGRLDYNAEGLLLLTNDGNFANMMMHPRYEIKKTYEAKLDKAIQKGDIDSIKRGVKLKDGFVRDIDIDVISNDKRVVTITVHEGKNKIVKRIFGSHGYYVQELKRTKIGDLTIGKLKAGYTRRLSAGEIANLLELATKRSSPYHNH